MTSYMNIFVSVKSNSAMAKLAAIKGEVMGLNTAVAAGNKMPGLGWQHMRTLNKFGNQLQWTGRMLLYNFTIPIIAAGAAATKWAMDNEKAMTKVQKVYGDTRAAAEQFRKASKGAMTQQQAEAKASRVFARELAALEDAFTAISNHYGVQKKEVLEVASAWAAAGVSGVALAKSVNLTMKAIIIGDMEAAKATESLIAIQGQFNLSTQELNATLAIMNSIENATAVSMSDLIDGFARSAGMARQAGVSVRELGAMMAALVPATGSAANAGNALKTLLSRLVAPTKEAAQVMKEMGLNTAAASWQSLNATERLKLMAKEFDGLHASAQNVAASVIASRWQVNRFAVLMKAIVDPTSMYAKALEAAEDQGYNFVRMQKELNTVLESDPRRLQRMWVMIQNGMSTAIVPIIPHILYLVDSLAKLTTGFSNLDPRMQKFIMYALLALAALGPLVRYIGALITLYSVLGYAVLGVGSAFGKVIKLFKPLIGAFKIMGTMIFTLLGWMGALVSGVVTGFATMTAAAVGWAARSIAAFVLFNGGVVGAFTATWARLVAIHVAGSATLLRLTLVLQQMSFVFGLIQVALVASWSAGYAALIRLTTAFGAALQTAWVAIYVGVGAVVTRGYLLVLLAQQRANQLFLAAQAAMSAVYAAIWRAMLVTQALAMAAWTGVFSLAFNAVLAAAGIWAIGVYSTITQIWWMMTGVLERAWMAMQFAILHMHAAFTAGMAALQATMATTIVGIWTAMKAAWAALQSGLYNLAVAGMARVVGVFYTSAIAIGLNWKAIALNFRWAMFIIWSEAKKMAIRLLAVLTGPWGIAIALVIALVYTFRDELKQIWENITGDIAESGFSIANVWHNIVEGIKKVFFSLPQAVQDVMVAVVTVIRDAALAVYDWFQYINPWASHSPSLVNNVTTGMDRVMSEFGKLSGIKKIVGSAYAEIKRFGNLTKGLGMNASQIEYKEDRHELKKAGASPAALASFDKMHQLAAKLEKKLAQLTQKIDAQTRVVEKWQQKLDDANKYLEEQEGILDKLGEKVEKWQGKLDEANDRLQQLASTPIQGMRAMEDAIFANEMATKRLRLSMMDLEDVYGTFDDIKGKIEAINGAQELLNGEQSQLRAAGAGSEILGQFDAQIDALGQQRDAYAEQTNKIADLQKQLDALNRTAERLDLTKSITFDPLLRQIDQMVNTVAEMSFGDIVAGIRDAQGDVARYTEKLNEATAAYDAQNQVVQDAIVARDAIQVRLDQETAQLDALKAKYDEVAEAIRAIEQAMQDVVAAAEKMNQKADEAKEAKKKKKDAAGAEEYVSPGLQAFRDAGKADFPDTGGSGMPTRTNWKGQVAEIEKFTDDLAFSTSELFAQINPFAPLKEKAKAAWEWIKDKAASIIPGIKDFFADAFSGVDVGGGPKKIGKKIQDAFEFITEVLKDIGKGIKWFVDFILPEVKGIGKGIWEGLKDIWETIGPKLAKFKDLIDPLGEAFHNAWAILKPILAVMGGALAFFVKGVLGGIAEAIGPLLDTIGKVLGGFIDMIRGVFEIIIGIFTLDGDMIMQGFKDIFVGGFTAIVNLIKAPLEAAWNFIKGFFQSIWDGAVWLWDELVGHSIIPDMIDGIVDAFNVLADLAKWVWDHVLEPVYDFFVKVWEDYIHPALAAWWEGFKLVLKKLWDLAVWIWDHVLEPVWDKINQIWKDYIHPALAAWWEGFKLVLKKLWDLAVWIWDNVLEPVWDKVKKVWDEYIQPGLAAWWEGFKLTLKTLWGLAVWIWDNVLEPAWQKIKELWQDHVKPELEKWRERFETAWSSLTKIFNWVQTNVMDPIFSTITGGWKAIKTWFEENSDLFTKPIKAIVNGAIAGVNALIKGVNKISDVLPGIDFEISLIPELAVGGKIPERQVGSGFKTNGARAIVGEGKSNYPEYVIPTDPTHRRRAGFLLHDAAKRIGISTAGVLQPGGEIGDAGRILAGQPTKRNFDGVPMYDIGGVMGWVKDKVGTVSGDAADWMVNKGKNMASFLADPFFDTGRGLLNQVGWVVPREIGKYGLDQAEAWVDGVDKAFNDIVKDQVLGGKGIQDAIAFAKSQVGKPYSWGGVGPDGYDCSGFMSALTNVIRGQNPYSRVGSTGTFPWAGFTSGVATGAGFTIGSSPSYSGGIGHMAGTLAGLNVESSGGVGVHVGLGARGYNDSGFTTHAFLAMKQGGIAMRRSGGTPIVVGDGRYDEAVVPLPKGWRTGSNADEGKVMNFYGDLSFPNITDPADVDLFIQNLENLAKD